jgi:hypothetical protein
MLIIDSIRREGSIWLNDLRNSGDGQQRHFRRLARSIRQDALHPRLEANYTPRLRGLMTLGEVTALDRRYLARRAINAFHPAAIRHRRSHHRCRDQ